VEVAKRLDTLQEKLKGRVETSFEYPKAAAATP
jgi:hypothetical protein